MQRIAIFASGSGTNAEEIIKYFKEKNNDVEVALVLSNKKDAFVLQRAKKLNVPSLTFTKEELKSGKVAAWLKEYKIDWIVLAGFLLKVPGKIIEAFPERIVNIHPALLPAYGGKGMYGERVHQAVIEAGEKESGISIHFVNENYDEGDIIFQAKCKIDKDDTPDSLADKIHVLEHKYFPKVLEDTIVQE